MMYLKPYGTANYSFHEQGICLTGNLNFKFKINPEDYELGYLNPRGHDSETLDKDSSLIELDANKEKLTAQMLMGYH